MSRFAVQPPASTRILVTGATDMGKTRWEFAYARPVRRVLAYDTQHEWEWLGLAGDAPPWSRAWIYVDELELLAGEASFRSGVLRQAVRPRPGEKERGPGNAHERFCRAARRIGNCLTVHAEISAYAGPSPGETYDEFTELIVRGRHYGVSIVADGQRLYQFPTALRENLSRAIIYRLPNKRAARALEELVDGPEAAQQALKLEPFHFLDWTPGGGVRVCAPVALSESSAALDPSRSTLERSSSP